MTGRWNSLILLIACAASAGGGAFLAIQLTTPALGDEHVQAVPSPSDPKYAEDEKAIQKNQEAYVKAFNAGDAKAVAEFWAPDGEFVGADGKTFKGRDAIAKDFAEFFGQSKGLKLEIRTESLRFVGPDVALESGASRVLHSFDDPKPSSAYQIVHVKRDGRWHLASVRETSPATLSAHERLRGLEWLVGNWTAKADGRSLEMTCEWAVKRNFLLRRYTLKQPDGTVNAGLQIIGWDPAQGAIRAWVFGSDGGLGSEVWSRDANRWVVEATGVTPDGAESAATNIITPIDPDTFSWQSAGRTLQGAPLPDTAIIKIQRVKPKG